MITAEAKLNLYPHWELGVEISYEADPIAQIGWNFIPQIDPLYYVMLVPFQNGIRLLEENPRLFFACRKFWNELMIHKSFCNIQQKEKRNIRFARAFGYKEYYTTETGVVCLGRL